MNASLQEPRESRMALKFSHQMNKDLKQNCWESGWSSSAWGSRISWAVHLPGPGLLPGQPRRYEYTFKDSKTQRSFTTHLLCIDLGWGGTELPGRLLDLNNKTPSNLYEGMENSRWTSPIEGKPSTHLMNHIAAVSWHMRLALVLKCLYCSISKGIWVRYGSHNWNLQLFFECLSCWMILERKEDSK